MNVERFIRRPILSTVISLVIMLAGGLSIFQLPVAEFPDIVPPQVEVKAYYPGASAEVISETVAAPLEQEINGVEGMIYLNSTSSSSGTVTITVTFEVGTDPDQNAINVSNRIQGAISSLPIEVQKQGVTAQKKSSSMLMVVSLVSLEGRYDTIYMNNYALVNVLDDLKRLPGVGDAILIGNQDYSMRVWLEPDRLAQYGLTPTDVANAIKEQNTQFAAGVIGQEPLDQPVETTFTVTTQGRLTSTEEFGEIILRADKDGAILRLKDVARLELGAQSYNLKSYKDDHPSVPIPIFLAPGANALDTADAVLTAMNELSANFPEGITYDVPYDTTEFVRISMNEVLHTLFEAMVLVFIIIYLFLQNWRATLIPCLAVPVSIIGAFAGMHALGFTINTLTLFGLVLAIGIVVDDAIVVIENVERIMAEELLGPMLATIKAMREVTAALIAIVLVLCSVFIPVAFLGGLAGELYRQFAVTIAVSVVISGVVALTLTPALCAMLLRPGHHKPWRVLRWFNHGFDKLTGVYMHGVRYLLSRMGVALILVGCFVAATVVLYRTVPGALLPEEDKGSVFSFTMLPDGASLSRTDEAAKQVRAIIQQTPGVKRILSLVGFDLLSGTTKTNVATHFIGLKDWSERNKATSSQALVGAIIGGGFAVPEGYTIAFNPPAIFGMSTTGGVEGYIQSRGGGSLLELQQVTQQYLQALAQHPEISRPSTTFTTGSPQLNIVLDREKAKAYGVPVSDVFATMQATFGSYYVNDFNMLGRTFQVRLQSEAKYRDTPADLNNVFVRSQSTKEMIPLTALVQVERTVGPNTVERYNVFPSAKVMAQPQNGATTGQLIDILEKEAVNLPQGYTLAWTGTAYQEKIAGGTSMNVYFISLLMVFLILAAQFERWPLPLAVVISVIFAVFGALLFNWARGLSNDIYFQVAMITLIGLSAKNAILIVEFAVQQRKEGKGLMEAAAEAARLRFRPIVMTSLAFVLGCLPLAIATGAGAASRHSIGTGIVGGMLVATFIGPLFVPTLYAMVVKTAARLSGKVADSYTGGLAAENGENGVSTAEQSKTEDKP